MILKPSARILITAPMKSGDATQYTYRWAQKAIGMAKNLGYSIKVLEKDQVNRANLEKAVKDFKPRLVLHIGHGCKYSVQGNNECIISQRYSINQIVDMAYSENINDRQKAFKLLNNSINYDYYVGDGDGNGNDSRDPCLLSCLFDSNIDILEGMMVVAIACHSSAGLGRDAIKMGIQAYVGYRDLLMFPVDTVGTEQVFGDIELVLVRELLLGHTIGKANEKIGEVEDNFIKKNKHIKYLALPRLWDKLNRELLGDKNAMLYQ